jgi:hypothetical protein
MNPISSGAVVAGGGIHHEDTKVTRKRGEPQMNADRHG